METKETKKGTGLKMFKLKSNLTMTDTQTRFPKSLEVYLIFFNIGGKSNEHEGYTNPSCV